MNLGSLIKLNSQKLFSLIVLLILCSNLDAQTFIKGQIVDKKGVTIIGANIALKGTYEGTSTDIDGKFGFETSEQGEQVLQISYIGYQTLEKAIVIGADTVDVKLALKVDPNSLDEVVITAGTFEAGDRKKGAVLNSLDIALTAGALADVAGALNTLPGTTQIGEEGKLFVRGGAGYETKTFIDGLPVSSPYNSSVPDLPSRGRFSAFLFKGTLFSSGGYSAEYGQALSSAMILETNDLAPKDITSVNLMTIGGGLGKTLVWDKASLSIEGSYSNMSPYFALIPQKISWAKAPEGVNGQVVYRQKTSDTGMLKFMGNASNTAMNITFEEGNSPYGTRSIKLEETSYYANSTYREALGTNWTLNGGFSYGNESKAVELDEFKVHAYHQSGNARLVAKFYGSQRFSIKFGANYQYEAFKEDFASKLIEQKNSAKVNDHLVAGFVEGDVQLGGTVAVKLGIRPEYSSVLQQFVVAPRASLALKVSEKSTVSMAYGNFYQKPENDLLKFDPILKFERADHYLINYQIINNDRIFRVEGYLKQYDSLVKYGDNEFNPSSYNNEGTGYSRGIDIFYRDKKSVKNGEFWVSYSFLDTKRNYLDFPELASPSFAAKHNLNIVYKHYFPKLKSIVGATYSFNDGRPYDNPNVMGFLTEKSKPFHDVSLNISYLANVLGNFTVFYASVNNIFGIPQEFGYRYSPTLDVNGQFPGNAITPPAPRFFFVGVFMSIGKKDTKDQSKS